MVGMEDVRDGLEGFVDVRCYVLYELIDLG
jgi:hypothetical protein